MDWIVVAHASIESFGGLVAMRHGPRSEVRSMDSILSGNYFVTEQFRVITLVEYYMVKYLTKLS